MSHLTFPNESAEYRTARNRLLADEIALRRQIEAVAEQRRALPPGGTVPEDCRSSPIDASLIELVTVSRDQAAWRRSWRGYSSCIATNSDVRRP